MRHVDEVVSATGLLGSFTTAGVLMAPDVHVAQTLGRLCGEKDAEVMLAAALAVRALRHGSVCLELDSVRERVAEQLRDPVLEEDVVDVDALPWPEPLSWREAVRHSPMVSQGADAEINDRPLRLVYDLLYLERYWAEETVVRTLLDQREQTPPPLINAPALARSLDALFDGRGLGADEEDRQRLAAQKAAHSWTTIVAGGPGTGKTTTVARLLAVLQEVSPEGLRIALAAPSGKASARLQEAVGEAISQLPPGIEPPRIASSSTLHKLLDARGAGRGFGRGPSNPLPQEVVVVDEMSMVALPLMARLLESLRPETRLVLVGDPHQLTSVDAGSVLADLVHSPRYSVVELEHTWRFGESIDDLARAIKDGDADRALALLDADGPVRLVEADAGHLALSDLPDVERSVISAGRAVHAASVVGDSAVALRALDEHRLLCAHREGRWGVARWGRMVEDTLRTHVEGYGLQAQGGWYVGRPLLITQNLRDLDLSNGDAGVVLATDQGLRAAIGTSGRARLMSPFLLDSVSSLHAMTVHKAQGSQFTDVTVVLPPPESALLTRELLYTAVTRASQSVTLVGDPQAVRRAIETPAVRASGLSRGW